MSDISRKEALQNYFACEQVLRENPVLYAAMEEYEEKSSQLLDLLASGNTGTALIALSEDVSRLNEMLEDNPQVMALRNARSVLMQMGCNGNSCGQCCGSSGACAGCHGGRHCHE